MTTELVVRARAGDSEAFQALIEPFRRELLVHCYRMLGSLQDAEDAVQESLLAAWQSIAGFEGRASVRTWLYRITTNRCLNARRAASRRPPQEWNVPGVQPPEPSRLGELPWLEPIPDVVFEGAVETDPGPEARYVQSESISLSFITALQLLPPRQIAVLVLRDVLGFPAADVADMLETTVDAVNGALKRARAGLRQHRGADQEPPAPAGSPAEEALVARFVRAYESADVAGLVALLTDDVFMSMPPMPLEYEGRELVGEFCARLFGARRSYALVPTRANGQPAFGFYVAAADGLRHGTGAVVLTLAGDRISALTHFERHMLASFGLPRVLSTEPDGSD